MYALKNDECKEMEAKLHQEQMESIFQRDMLQYLIQDKADVAVDHGVIWQGRLYQVSAGVEQGLTSHQTHYRSYRGRVLWVKRPNQQCQSTEGREVLRTRLQCH